MTFFWKLLGVFGLGLGGFVYVFLGRGWIWVGWVLGWVVDIGYWILDIGYWILDIGYWILDIGYWVLNNNGRCEFLPCWRFSLQREATQDCKTLEVKCIKNVVACRIE